MCLEVVKEILDGGEDAGVVGGGGQHKMAVAETLGDELAGVGVAGVIHGNALHAAVGEDGGHLLGCRGGMTIDTAVNDEHALLFGTVAAPGVMLANEIAEILSPDGAMQGAYHLDVKSRGLLQHILHLNSVLADDVDVIATGIVEPVTVEVHLVGKNIAVQGAEGAESVGGEEYLVCQVVGHHHLGPMHHRSHDKGEVVATRGELVSLLDNHQFRGLATEELLHHLGGLGGGHHGGLRITQQQVGEKRGMVGLHVVHHQVVERPVCKGGGDILEILLTHSTVGGVEEHRLLVAQQITVIRHPTGDGINILEQGQATVAGAHIIQVVGNSACVLHSM